MANYEQRLKALENIHDNALGELPMIVNDNCTDEEIKRLQCNGRKVYRQNDNALMDEFV